MKRRPMVAVESFGNWRTQSRHLVVNSKTATARDVSVRGSSGGDANHRSGRDFMMPR
jgi:hypothetical protein